MGVCTAMRDKNLTPALLKPKFFFLLVVCNKAVD